MEYPTVSCRRVIGITLALLVLILVPIFDRGATAGGLESDKLDVRFLNKTEIFTPREAVALEIRSPESSLSELLAEKTVNLHVAVFRHGEPAPETVSNQWRRHEPAPREAVTELELQISIDEKNSWIPVSLLAPSEEGVYEIVVSLHRKAERSGNTILSIPTNPLQRKAERKPVKIFAEKTVQCVVFDATPSPRPSGDPLLIRKELLETVDATQPGWRQRLLQMPSLPKVGNLAAPLTAPLASARLPEMPRWGTFRERPSRNAAAEPEPTTVQEPKPPHRVLAALLEQWRKDVSEKIGSDNIGSGHLREGIALPPEVVATPFPNTEVEQQVFCALSGPEMPNTETWEALPLAVQEIGRPHLLELDHPAAHPQELGVSVVEMFDRQGQTVPVVIAGTGLRVAEEIVSETLPKTVATHRVLFWPKTKNPMLLLVNRQLGHDAVFGKARLYRIFAGSPETESETKTRLPKPLAGTPRRRVLGYLHRTEAWDLMSSEGWSRTLDGAERLVDRLHCGGYDGVMITAVSKESTLYPSENFCTETAPPGEATKDRLELLHRLFDREQMPLVPVVDFNRKLRKIEDRRLERPDSADELYWEGTGRYNLLHPDVQDAMFEIVAEIVRRYSGHPSFGGLAVQLSPEGHARLPITVRTVDDRTFSEFLAATDLARNMVLPPELSTPQPNTGEWLQQKTQRGMDRARFLQGDAKAWEAWVTWRTQKVRDFYARLAALVAEARPDTKLYLTGGTMLDTPELRDYCTPTLTHWMPLHYVLQMNGFDLAMLKEIPSLVFLRPSRIEAVGGDACYEQFDSADVAALFAQDGSMPGTLFFHESDGISVTTPAGNRNRRRFIKQLAQSDVLEFFDGGNALPSGEEEFLYDFLAAYRQLPPVPFQTFVPAASATDGMEKSIQPVTVRYSKQENGLVVYLLNDAPFAVEAVLGFSSTRAELRELSGRRSISPLRPYETGTAWQVGLGPYDFIAVRLEDPRAGIRDVHVRRPALYCASPGELHRKVDRLNERIRDVQQGIPWDKLENPGFEIVSETPEEIAGWRTDKPKGESRFFTTRLDSVTYSSGRHAVKLEGHPGIAEEPGLLWSNVFEAPSTGRIFVSISIGIPENAASIPLNVVLAGRYHGSDWNRSFAVQPQLMPQMATQPPVGGVRWHRLIVPFDRLPQDSLEDLRLGFQLFGPGAIWIDDISLYHVSFSPNEIKTLQRLVLAARARCNQDRVSDLMTILEGHWAQFLFRHVPDRPEPISNLATAPPAVTDAGNKPYAGNAAKEEPPKKENRGVLGRIKGLFGR